MASQWHVFAQNTNVKNVKTYEMTSTTKKLLTDTYSSLEGDDRVEVSRYCEPTHQGSHSRLTDGTHIPTEDKAIHGCSPKVNFGVRTVASDGLFIYLQ